jgi:hypothetical protein
MTGARVAAALSALFVLSGCVAVTPDRANPLPDLVPADRAGEMSLFVYADRDSAADAPDRRGYSLSFPVLDPQQRLDRQR